MKVLKKGRPQKGWAKEYTCTGYGNGGGGCGAQLLVEQHDVFVTHSSAMGESEYHNTFRCVECGVLTDIKDSLSFSARKATSADLGKTDRSAK